MSNVQRVIVDQDVSELVLAVDRNQAHQVLEAAYDTQAREQRPMTLREALVVIGEISRAIEAL